jgi:hypothetical protein
MSDSAITHQMTPTGTGVPALLNARITRHPREELFPREPLAR